ncbi:glycosyltransferase family 2 protein [Candidatus Woesebacteria bacterium]|nr:glycosyltransferase family 2 protein [Candidatus Woesebacteria bacterium]
MKFTDMTTQINRYDVDKSSKLYRFIEIMIPLLVWATIFMPVWLSFFHPAVAAYLILGYMIYFFYKAMKTAYYSMVSFRLMKRVEQIDWLAEVKQIEGHRDIHHFILVVNYKESVAKLVATMEYLTKQNYDLKKIHVVFGMEVREGNAAKERSAEITEKFGTVFGSMDTTYHEIAPGEAIGKASNATHAAKFISETARQLNIPAEKVVVTVCDADSLLPPNYLACVTYKFLVNPESQYHFYAAPVLLYNNFWKLPMPVRVQTILSSVARFAYLSQEDVLIQISTYSTNLSLIETIGYWDTDVIPEDWHIWMQAFFTLGDKVKTIPIYMPIIRDGLLSTSLIKTFKARYEQEKRWAWGVTDIPYALIRSFHSPQINFVIKLKRVLHICETHFFWPTSFFLLTVSASIPPLVNPIFSRTVFGFLLPKLSSFILTLSSVVLILSIYLDYKLRERAKIKTDLRNVPMLFIQWYLLPVISLLFSSLPALEAHTRMLMGKKLEYKVQEKV